MKIHCQLLPNASTYIMDKERKDIPVPQMIISHLPCRPFDTTQVISLLLSGWPKGYVCPIFVFTERIMTDPAIRVEYCSK